MCDEPGCDQDPTWQGTVFDLGHFGGSGMKQIELCLSCKLRHEREGNNTFRRID